MTDQALALAQAGVFMQQRPVLCSLPKTRWVPQASVVKSQLRDLECVLGHAVNHSVLIGDAARPKA